jgi:ribosomal-protein-alanine N-acetyltransferase
MDTDSVGELESVVVAEDARRMGLGRALCKGILGWCRDRGVREIELEVRSRNYSAKRLYTSLGFVEEGLRRGYYRDPIDDAALMRIHFEEI